MLSLSIIKFLIIHYVNDIYKQIILNKLLIYLLLKSCARFDNINKTKREIKYDIYIFYLEMKSLN